jgi:hypothetical protein
LKKRLGAGGTASVVWGQEDVALEGWARRRNKAFLAPAFDIARKKKGDAAKADLDDEGTIVYPVALAKALGAALQGAVREELHAHALNVHWGSEFGRGALTDLAGFHGGHEIQETFGFHEVSIVPEFLRPKGPGDEPEPVQMVRLGMGQDQIVHPHDLVAPQIGGHEPLPHVKALAREPAAIDQHSFSLRKLHQGRVALAHVQVSDPEIRMEIGPVEPVSSIDQGQEEDEKTSAFGPAESPEMQEKEDHPIEKDDFERVRDKRP